jgi:hypothetical protein
VFANKPQAAPPVSEELIKEAGEARARPVLNREAGAQVGKKAGLFDPVVELDILASIELLIV